MHPRKLSRALPLVFALLLFGTVTHAYASFDAAAVDPTISTFEWD